MQLEGKVIVVTGAGRGIGAAIARSCAAAGAAVMLSARSEGEIAHVACAIGEAGGLARTACADMTRADDIERLIAAAEDRLGGVDVLVNNAGTCTAAPFLDLALADWQRMIDVNLTGAFLCAQAAARAMIRRGGGTIINISSISGQRGGSGRAAYGASKAGLELLTKVMAVELAEHGIRVNAIAPGPIETEMVRLVHTEDTRRTYARLVPLRRYGTPEEVASVAVFLASDAAAYVTGHVLNADGGFAAAGIAAALGRRAGASCLPQEAEVSG